MHTYALTCMKTRIRTWVHAWDIYTLSVYIYIHTHTHWNNRNDNNTILRDKHSGGLSLRFTGSGFFQARLQHSLGQTGEKSSKAYKSGNETARSAQYLNTTILASGATLTRVPRTCSPKPTNLVEEPKNPNLSHLKKAKRCRRTWLK